MYMYTIVYSTVIYLSPSQDRRQHQGLHPLHPAELCRDEQAVGAHAAPGAHSREGAQGEGEAGAEDSGGDEPCEALPTGGH